MYLQVENKDICSPTQAEGVGKVGRHNNMIRDKKFTEVSQLTMVDKRG